MKSYLVNVPVKVNIWIRPNCQKRQFEIIKKARPSILFFVSDGGRNAEEQRLIEENRKLYETIDWECTVYKLYEENNQGMYAMSKKSKEFIWNKVDRCVFLEDDIIPSVSFFRYCAEMLEKYKDDQRVHIINGMNHLGIYEDVNADYFFSRVGSIWGFATWKRVYDAFGDFEYANDTYVLTTLLNNARKDTVLCDCICGYSKGEYVGGHMPGGEFYFSLAVFLQNQLNIIPKRNMISNIGCGDDATHGGAYELMPKGVQQIFNMRTYEMEFPIRHTDYVIPDYKYEKLQKRIMAWHHPIIAMYRYIIHVFKILRYRGAKEFYNAIIKKMKRERRLEK